MKRTLVKIISAILVLALFLSLGSCAFRGEEASPAEETILSDELVPGYVSTAIQVPDWLGGIRELTLEGGTLYLVGQTAEGYSLGSFHIASGTWTEIGFDRSGLKKSSENNGFPAYAVSSLTAAEGTVWAMLEQYTDSGRDSYILRFDAGQDSAARRVKVGFEAGANTESTDRIFTGLRALDGERAILSDFSGNYLIDSSARLLQTLPGQELNYMTAARNNGRLMVCRTAAGQYGSCLFAPAALSAGETKTEEPLDCVSENGHWLRAGMEGLYLWDEDSGAETLIFRWLDAALSYDDVQLLELSAGQTVEDSAGNFYHFGTGADYIIKTSPGMVKDKTVLTLATFGTGSGVLDAVLRFNNSSPDYKVELLSYDGWTEKDKFLMDMTTGKAADIVDLSSLPDSAIDSGVFVDLLPYIDSDPELSRENFIQPVFNSMLRDGQLCKLTVNFSLITFEARASQFPGREGWTIDYVNELIANRGENTPVFFWHRNRDALLDMLCLMSTAEYIDWETGTCSFESEGFKQWLRFVRDIPYTDTYTEDAVLMHPDGDVGYRSAYYARSFLQEDYVYAGFPGTSGSGSYFTELGDDSFGSSICYGISAASEHKDAAWEFLRILLQCGGPDGFPVLRSAFEEQLESAICEESEYDFRIFTRSDADKLRELVYSTEKTVHREEELLALIRQGAEQYFSGQKSLDEAAALIQSRAAIYVAEKG